MSDKVEKWAVRLIVAGTVVWIATIIIVGLLTPGGIIK